ncbi:MAG: stage 0 sporulation family protein [Erysipelotrichaceae bacterium]
MSDNYSYTILVNYFNGNKSYTFGTDLANITSGDLVVVESIQGLQLAEVTRGSLPTQVNQNSLEIKGIERLATVADKKNHEDNIGATKSVRVLCQSLIEKHQLNMTLLQVTYTLDKSKVLFVYVAEDRVDFRNLLKDLAAELRCRIELKQIGPRDKAKMIGGIGCCGRETCCSKHIKSFSTISINMAKNQLLALNTQKLSGLCGKLKCCLKYEDDIYKELRVGLPKMNSLVTYQNKKYRLTSLNVINDEVKISNKLETIDLTIDELRSIVAINKENKSVTTEKL